MPVCLLHGLILYGSSILPSHVSSSPSCTPWTSSHPRPSLTSTNEVGVSRPTSLSQLLTKLAFLSQRMRMSSHRFSFALRARPSFPFFSSEVCRSGQWIQSKNSPPTGNSRTLSSTLVPLLIVRGNIERVAGDVFPPRFVGCTINTLQTQ